MCHSGSIGTLNGIDICLEHWDEVTARILVPSRFFLRKLLKEMHE